MARTRTDVEFELAQAVEHRDHAARILDFDAYQNIVSQIDDLLLELGPLLPSPRQA